VLGLEGDELGCFRSPCGMAIDSSRLFVADTLNCRIQVFSTLVERRVHVFIICFIIYICLCVCAYTFTW
jgi:hypothetical protein